MPNKPPMAPLTDKVLARMETILPPLNHHSSLTNSLKSPKTQQAPREKRVPTLPPTQVRQPPSDRKRFDPTIRKPARSSQLNNWVRSEKTATQKPLDGSQSATIK
jgi:hypothetical protein